MAILLWMCTNLYKHLCCQCGNVARRGAANPKISAARERDT